jgi:hypothetical protein
VGARLAAAALVGLVLASFGGVRRAAGDPLPDDGAPSGTVAFFPGGACPAGWVPSPLAEGRLVVGVVDSATVGLKVGAPLADREDRTHQHTYTGTVDLPDKAIAAADGSNQQGAAAQTYTVMGTTTAQTSGLGFVQVQACEKP